MANNSYAVTFKNKQVDLFDYNGKIIRRFNTRAKVVNAQVNGSGKDATIAICMCDGGFEIYKSDGTMIRRN